MDCEECKNIITIKNANEWISIKCKCKIMIIYSDYSTKTIPKTKYDPQYHKTK